MWPNNGRNIDFITDDPKQGTSLFKLNLGKHDRSTQLKTPNLDLNEFNNTIELACDMKVILISRFF